MSAFMKLKRHPIPMESHFEHCLVLTYSLPANQLEPLLPPGLSLDLYGESAFLAVALVSVRSMRPRGVPEKLGLDCTLTGYRVFTRFSTPSGPTWRGLRILRSETNNPWIRIGGNLLTHYNYHRARSTYITTSSHIDICSEADDGLQLCVRARINPPASHLPPGSVFPDFQQARRFAGPLPFTFDYELESHSIISIRGRRGEWNPVPVEVESVHCDFLNRFSSPPVLSNAFYLHEIPYSWDRGMVFPLSRQELT